MARKKLTREQEITKIFFKELASLAEENGIPMELLVDKISGALYKAVRKQYDYCDDFVVNIVPEENIFDVCVLRTVVDDEPIDLNEINIEEAVAVCDPRAKLGMRVPFKLSTTDFGRVAAQAAKQAIHNDIRDFEREKFINQFMGKEHEMVSATVQKVEPATGNAIITIDANEVYLLKNEQIPGEVLKEGQIIKVYIGDIINKDRKPIVKISRKTNDLVRRLFELEIPEIYDGTVEIKSIAREAGSRTKIAVWSKDENVDPIGSCIGPKHSRIEKIVSELSGEKIDIIVYDEDITVFIAHSLAPAEVISVTADEEVERKYHVIVPNSQQSLAIGNKGQNAKLAARLTGCKIDINPEQPIGE